MYLFLASLFILYLFFSPFSFLSQLFILYLLLISLMHPVSLIISLINPVPTFISLIMIIHLPSGNFIYPPYPFCILFKLLYFVYPRSLNLYLNPNL